MTQPTHPDLENWKVAKRSSFLLAANMGAIISQLPDGGKLVRYRDKKVPCKSWLSVYCYLRDWRLEQIEADKAATAAAKAKECTSRPVAASKPLPLVNPPGAVAKVREPPRGVYVDLDGNPIPMAKFV